MLGRTFAAAPDPELARVAFSRVGDVAAARAALARPEITDVAARLLGFSTAADRLPGGASRRGRDAGRRGGAERRALDAEVAADIDRLGPTAGLRRFRRRAMLRVAARDLAGAPLEDVVAEISAIADACIAEALVLTPGGDLLTVIALGKLGGSELNYASRRRPPVRAPRSGAGRPGGRRARGRRLHPRCCPSRRPRASRSASTPRSAREDARGALSRSLDATLAYYDARVRDLGAPGDDQGPAGRGRSTTSGRRSWRASSPSSIREELAPAAIDEVRRTKVRLEEYIRQRGKELHRGQARVAAGSATSSSRCSCSRSCTAAATNACATPNTLARAPRARDRGLRRRRRRRGPGRCLPVPPDGSSTGSRSCGTSRRTTSRPTGHARTTLARSLGLDGRRRAGRREYERHDRRSCARSTSDSSTGRCSRPSPGRRIPRPRHRPRGHRGAARRPRVRRAGPRLRRARPARRSRPRRVGKVLAHLFPVMAPALALAPAPDAALVRLERVADAVGDERAIADALASDSGRGAPPGPRGRRQLVRHRPAGGRPLADPRPLRFAPRCRDRRRPAIWSTRSPARRAASSRRARRARRSRAVAVRVIREAVAAAEPDLPFAVIGMGKLGARELNVASDLDLLFVYEGEGPGPLKRAGVLAERVLRGIREAGWEPDADLRPEGRNGPLARSIAAYLEYWERYAETWEFQALLRARAVAGDADLGRRFELNAADFAYPPDGLTIDRVARDPAHARADRARAGEAARGGEVPLQARDRLARRRPVRGGALADAARRPAPGDPFASHPGGDRPPGGRQARCPVRSRATWARRSCSAPT